MQLTPEAIIKVGEHKAIRFGGVTCEIEPHTIDEDFVEYDIDAVDEAGNDFHHRYTLPYPWKKPGNFPDTHFLGKTLHVEVIEPGVGRFSLN